MIAQQHTQIVLLILYSSGLEKGAIFLEDPFDVVFFATRKTLEWVAKKTPQTIDFIHIKSSSMGDLFETFCMIFPPFLYPF